VPLVPGNCWNVDEDQSPTLKWNLEGRLMTRLVTSEGRITPALIVVFPVLKFTTAILATLSTSQIEPGTTISFQQMGAWRRRRGK